ncbi:MAG: hypothetical protein GY780_08460, partial [bacterium]|nr:hypothetical protein [bacterium]
TSKMQLLVVLAFIGFAFLTTVLFNDFFSVEPYDLFGLDAHAETENVVTE